MGIKDLVKKGVDAIDKGSTALDKSSVMQGILGNYSAFSNEEATKEFGGYLMTGEEIEIAFKLVRDVLLFTSDRILLFDKQGMTGKKIHVVSINLHAVVSVTMETAGFGYDDSELSFTYIKSPYLKAQHVEYGTHKFEFPKKFDVQSFYKLFQELAYENVKRINNL